jgi:hypothetical protein
MGFIDYISGASGADAQDAATKEQRRLTIADIDRQRQFASQQAGIARGDVAGYSDQAADALQGGADQASGYNRAGLTGSLKELIQGQKQATGYLQQQPNRLGDIYNQDFAGGFEQDPGYQFRQQQGEQAINRSAAARGGRMGADTLKSLMNFNSGLASQEYDNWNQRRMGAASGADQGDWARNSSLSGLVSSGGQQRAGAYGQYGTNQANLAAGTGGSLAQLLQGTGLNLAGISTGLTDQNNALTQMRAGARMGSTQYVGGGDTARGNWMGGLIGTVGGKAAGAAFGAK